MKQRGDEKKNLVTQRHPQVKPRNKQPTEIIGPIKNAAADQRERDSLLLFFVR